MNGVPAAERSKRAEQRGRDGMTVVMVVLLAVVAALMYVGVI